MDPVADKVLVLGAFLAFVELRLVPAWMVILIFLRELLITSLRIFAITKGEVLQVSLEGKHKTASQMVAIFSILIFLVLKETARVVVFWNASIESWWHTGILLLMGATVILTLTSGVSYVWRNRNLLISRSA
jgi:CDP-diacylglycerol--glycerol-3-phosphate 3-phosphatidyltransferase